MVAKLSIPLILRVKYSKQIKLALVVFDQMNLSSQNLYFFLFFDQVDGPLLKLFSWYSNNFKVF